MRPEIRALQEKMRAADYIADRPTATAVHLARVMEKPLLVEGDAGVGKTEIAKVMAAILDTELIRLQCYEGLDANTALYEWNYPKQLLRLRMDIDAAEQDGNRTAGEAGDRADHLEGVIFSRHYLLERPLLRAITRPERPPVLLIDEVDRADDGFEAFLLEVLSDFQVTIPELGTIAATHRPMVVLTSNGTREIGDALRRRCLYLYIDHPPFAKELEIVRAKVPGISDSLATEITHFVQKLRTRRLMKPPGVAETLDWARALVTLHQDRLDADVVAETLGCVVKDQRDALDLEAEDLGALVGAWN